ncbi:MAG TPA: hypothetical protein VFQ61_04645, partial [Polyangiaceae bacterium]|nr:hypothetical protein [Polyangiaceae bacterium]
MSRQRSGSNFRRRMFGVLQQCFGFGICGWLLACAPQSSSEPSSNEPPTSGPPTPTASSGGWKPASTCPTLEEQNFSFFLMSHAAVVRQSGSPD